MPQLNLNFTDIPISETCLWEQFDDEQKRTLIENSTLTESWLWKIRLLACGKFCRRRHESAACRRLWTVLLLNFCCKQSGQ